MKKDWGEQLETTQYIFTQKKDTGWQTKIMEEKKSKCTEQKGLKGIQITSKASYLTI